MKPNPLPAFAGGILAGGCLIALLFFALGEALAGSPPAHPPLVDQVETADSWVGRATGPTAVFCLPKRGMPISAIPSEGTYVAPCLKSINDGGTVTESDGGQPCVASVTDSVLRPTTSGPAAIPLNLTTEEVCVAIKVQSGDAGTVDFFKRTVP